MNTKYRILIADIRCKNAERETVAGRARPSDWLTLKG